MLFATVACSESVRETAAAASFSNDICVRLKSESEFCQKVVVKLYQFCKLLGLF